MTAASIGWLAADLVPGVHGGTTTRTGGVSRDAFATLNLADHVGDDPTAVAENRARVHAALGLPAAPLWLRQVHGNAVVVHDGTAREPQADAAVAFAPGRVLAVLTADCVPVALASRDGSRIGLAHAGWRGLAAGVLECTIAALGVPGEALVAWLGPAIGPAAFEVGHEVRDTFMAAEPADARAFQLNARGRWQADLGALVRARLARLGLTTVIDAGACTHADSARFYSYRRERDAGRMATLLWRAG